LSYFSKQILPSERVKNDLEHGRITKDAVRAKSEQYAAEFCDLMGDPPFFDKDTDWRGRNAEWREIMWNAGEKCLAARVEIFYRCRKDPAYFIAGFMTTYKILKTDGEQQADVPFILYDYQVELVRWMVNAIRTASAQNQKKLFIDKSREMGMSWIACAVALHQYLFDVDCKCLYGTIDIDALKTGMDSIFPKIKYSNDRLPVWMQGKHKKDNDTFMLNAHRGQEVKGDAMNSLFGRGGRRSFILCDEGGHISKLQEALTACSNSSNCVILFGTPQGVGGYFGKIRKGAKKYGFDLFKFSNVKIKGKFWDGFGLHWTLNPDFVKGLYMCGDKSPCPVEGNNGVCKKKTDPEYEGCNGCFRFIDCPVHGNTPHPHSTWYDSKGSFLTWDKKMVATELDINYAMSGNCAFNIEALSKSIEFIREVLKPKFTYYELDWLDGQPTGISSEDIALRCRGKHPKANAVKMSSFRVFREPIVGHIYVLGADPTLSSDTGSFANAYVFDVTDMLVVAEYNGRIKPEAFGYELAKICKWYSTNGNLGFSCLCVVERQGGGDVVNMILDSAGCLVYTNTVKKTRAECLGFNMAGETKNKMVYKYLEPAFQEEREFAGKCRLVCPFVELYEEAQTFISVERTELGKGIAATKEKFGAQNGTYDDRVMSVLYCLIGMCEYFGEHNFNKTYDEIKGIS